MAIMTTYINISGQTLDTIDVEAIVVAHHVLKNISNLLGDLDNLNMQLI